MSARVLLVFCTLLSLSWCVVGNPPSAYTCPKVSNPAQTTVCDQLTYNPPSPDCFDRCCRQTGRCYDSSCQVAFGTSNAGANCAGSCLTEISCIPYKTGCTGNSPQDPHCWGFTQCITPSCGGFTGGQVCLQDGVSANFKVCLPGSGGFVVGDPQFVGLRGQQYQVHGVSGYIYNIVSDDHLQYNAKFIFLNSGDCPVVNGVKVTQGCFAHPGSYLGELGLKTSAGDKIHLIPGAANNGFDVVEVNDRALEIGETLLLADDLGSVTYNSTHITTVIVDHWSFIFQSSDRFVNQHVKVSDSRRLHSHGMLGQTWRDKTYKNTIKHIEGNVDDYVIREKNIWGDQFSYNVFN